MGRYEEALSLLVSPSSFEAISFNEYTTWHRAIADVLRLKATRRQDEAVLHLLAESFPARDAALLDYDIEDAVDTPSALVELALRYLESSKSSLTEKVMGSHFRGFSRLTAEDAAEALLEKAAQRVQSSQPMLSLMPTLASLSIAKDMDCSRLILRARVQLAETLGLYLQMPDGARLLMELDLPNCLSSDDVELRARAQWTYARVLLSCWNLCPPGPGKRWRPQRPRWKSLKMLSGAWAGIQCKATLKLAVYGTCWASHRSLRSTRTGWTQVRAARSCQRCRRKVEWTVSATRQRE